MAADGDGRPVDGGRPPHGATPRPTTPSVRVLVPRGGRPLSDLVPRLSMKKNMHVCGALHGAGGVFLPIGVCLPLDVHFQVFPKRAQIKITKK